MQQGNGVLRAGACSGVGTRSGRDLRRLLSFETNDLKLCGHRGARRHGHIGAREDRRRHTQSITSGSGETLLESSRESPLLRGEFGAKLEGGDDWVRPFSWPKWNFEKFFLDAPPTAFNCLSSAIRD